MADFKISQLASANVVNKDDLIYLIQNDTDFNVKASTLFASITDPTLSGNIIVSGPVQTLNAAGAVSITTTRTDLYGGKSANTSAVANGSILPTTVFLYTEGVSASGRGIKFVDGTPTNKLFYARHLQGKIYLSTASGTVFSHPPEDWVGPTGLRPFATELAFVKGATYTFDVSDASLASNVINLSTSIDGTNTLGTAYTPGVTKNGNSGTPGANIVFTVPNVTVDTGGLAVLDIAQGVDGQLKIINLVRTDGGRYVLSSNLQNNLAVELRKSGDSAFLMYSSNGWILVGSNPGLVTSFSGTSDDIPEGAKLYFTNARARAAITASDNTILYDNTTGTIRANILALSNINLANIIPDTNSVPEGLNLYYTNNRVRSNVIALLPTLAGSGISIAANGQISATVGGGNVIATSIVGLNTANVTESVSNLYYTNARVYANVIGLLNAKANVVDLTTANVIESTNNLYYTNARVSSNVIALLPTLAGSGISIAANGQISASANVTISGIVGLNTANVTESVSNLYYTNARVYANVIGLLNTKANVVDLTTSNVVEGNNLYYTNARVSSNVIALLPTLAGSGISIAANGQISASANVTISSIVGLNTANVAESASNLYYTNARVYSNVIGFLPTLAGTGISIAANGQISASASAPTAQTVIGLNTANVAESVSNLYYTNARVYANVIGLLNAKANTVDLTTANVIESTGNLYFTNARVYANVISLLNEKANVVDLTTSNVAEGNNLYYTNARVLSNVSQMSINVFADVDITGIVANGILLWNGTGFIAGPPSSITQSNITQFSVNVANTVLSISNFTTSNLAEGINLYFTNARVISAIEGANLTIANANSAATANTAIFAQTANVANTVTTISNFTTSNLAEGNNLYFTNARAIAAIQPSIAELRALTSNFASNVLYVAQNGNDANDGRSYGNAFANIHVALAAATQWTTVFLKSGDYRLYNQPVTIPRRVALVGDNLRTTTVRPSQPSVDMFYVNNACYVTGITFRDHVAPSAVFSYNPNGSAGQIVTSPYIQNCSSITTTGTGMRVDGRFVSGLRSMVCDAYTQTNEGGIGIHMLNQGYTQLVSVFTICCHIAILCESGGFCSVTNSNASFGTYALWADGVSPPLYYGTVQTGNSEAVNELTLSNLTIRPNYGDSVLFANYDQAKCSRDTGLIVDSLAFDLAYGGNSQSNFAGLQYWSQTASAIPNQSVETLDAINFALGLAIDASKGETLLNVYQVGVPAINGVAGTIAEADIVSNLNVLLTSIITNGTVGVTDIIIPNKYPANTNVNINNAANNIVINKAYIAAETLAYVDLTYPGFFANANNFIDGANAQATCSRDVGYILDSIVFDLKHSGNKQTVQAGTFYYQYNANLTQINNQVVQTGAAYDFIGTLIGNIVTATAVSKGYNSAKCERDTGLIVDSIAMDLLYSGNSQANFAGLQYWSQTASAIPNQSEETLDAIRYAMNTSYKIAIGQAYTPLQGNVAYVSATTGDGFSANILTARFGNVISIITNGTVGVTDTIVPNDLYPSANVSRINTANIVLSNKSFIAAETIAYIDLTYPGFFANTSNFIVPANARTTCSRDVGYIIDSTVFDLLHNGNKQSVQAGTFYYQYNANTTQINNQIVKTGQSYIFIAGLIDKILSNTIIAPLYQTTVAQNTSAAPAATISERNKIAQSANLIVSIISSGPSVALAKTPIGANVSSNVNVRNAANAIIANRDFIKAETIAYVDLELFDPPYQIAVKQNTTAAPAATYAEANIILQRIDLITNIISNGPSSAVAKTPIGLTANTNSNVINATKLILANRDYIKAEVLEYVNRSWANISNGSGTFYTVLSATNLVSNTSTVTFLQAVTENIRTGSRASFHQGSYISSSGHTFEYVGSGDTIATALPYLGGVPIQENEVTELRGGQVYFTSTDQLGDFRIGKGLVINRVDGTITGRTFNKALFAVMTPYILAIEG